MIEATELRLGNFFFNSQNEIQRVTIPNLEYLLNPKMGPHDGIQPIPLTPDILYKCGFAKIELPAYICNGEPGYEIIITESANRWLLITGKFQKFTFLCENHSIASSASCGIICFLHQLQNLYFALTGKELSKL